jgi:hypothetical protein
MQKKYSSWCTENSLTLHGSAAISIPHGAFTERSLPISGSIENDTVPWAEFYQALVAKLGTAKRSQMIFAEHINQSPSNLQNWRKRGSVPLSAMAEIDGLVLEKVDFGIVSGMHKNKVYKRVQELKDEGFTNRETSEILSHEFSRKITINAVKGIRRRSKTVPE